MYFEGKSDQYKVIVWLGNPDCQAAHDALLIELEECCTSFLSSIPTDNSQLNTLKGNLGEFIGFCIGKQGELSTHLAFAANAYTPLDSIARPDIDIVWLYFGKNPDEDVAILQEVKTTGRDSLSYADNLIKDYEKLFGPNQKTTLNTRLQAIKNKLEYEHKKKELCLRVSELAGESPHTSSRIKLLPTLVYERSGINPSAKMVTIRSILCGKGWSPAQVEAWAIGLSNLNSRLLRLATGER